MEYEHLVQEIDSQDLFKYDPLSLSYEPQRVVNNDEIIENVQISQLPPTGMLPCQDNFDGDFGFSISINGLCQNKSWVYSSLLDCIYIRPYNVLIMQFKTREPLNGPYYIRAMLVYLNSDDALEPVKRCTNHTVDDDPTFNAHKDELVCHCDKFNNVQHVIQSENGIYCFDPASKRHSVVTELQKLEAGSDSFSVPYKFTCKSSCLKGMHKRPVRIIYTLEDANYNVLGRKVIQVRICSSPKRDMKRQEIDYISKENKSPNRKRSMTPDEAPTEKKVKLEPEASPNEQETVQKIKEELAILMASATKVMQIFDQL